MAKPVFMIQFPSPASPDLMHRVLNYAEDVFRGLRDKGIGSIDDIDNYASGCFIVRVSASRHIGEVSSLISSLLVHHNLESQGIVSRADHLKDRSE